MPLPEIPNDVRSFWLNRLSSCPEAQEEFSELLDNPFIDQGIVKAALSATARYLEIYQIIQNTPDVLDDHIISEFQRQVQQASSLLNSLGKLPEHQSYIIQKMHDIMSLINKDEPEHTPSKTTSIDPLSEFDIREIEKHIDQLSVEDLDHIYKKQEHEELEESFEELELDEDLTAAQRIKKRFDFLKSKSKREIALHLALHRISTNAKIKKRGIIHARQMIMDRLLKGRDKSDLSAGEKSRLEKIVHNAKDAVIRISNRLIPKLRQLEAQRVLGKINDVTEEMAEIPNNPIFNYTKDSLEGLQNRFVEINPKAIMNRSLRKHKNFRKLEV